MAKGKTLLLTRPAAQSRAFARQIAEKFPATRCIVSPLIDIVFDGELPDLTLFQALVFTSANGVRAFVAAGGKTRLPCYCVGPRTTTEATRAGLAATSADGGIENIARLLRTTLPQGARVLHIHGEHVAGTLDAARLPITGAVLYRQPQRALTAAATDALAAGDIDALPLFSPRSAEILATAFRNNPAWPTTARPLCLSRAVANRLTDSPLPAASIAGAPNAAGMLALIADFLG